MMSTTKNNKKTVKFFDDMLDYFKELNKLQAKIGVHAEAGQDNVNKAKWNEFGTTHKTKHKYVFQSHGKTVVLNEGSDISIPARPFIRLYLYQEYVNRLVKLFIKDVNDNLQKDKIGRFGASKTFRVLGKEALLCMREKMYGRNFNKSANNTNKDQEKNAGLTQYLKEKDMPLFDTAEMYNVMDYKVERRNL